MFNSEALSVVIGLTFIYLLYSLLATLLQEIIATNIGLRGLILKKAIKRMLDDDQKTAPTCNCGKPDDEKCTGLFSDAFYKHPLIKYLASDAGLIKKLPAYITRETFSKVVIDLLRGKNVKPGDSARQPIQESLDKEKIAWDDNTHICLETLNYLNSIWVDANGDVQKFKTHLEQWFTETMDRASGWYKKKVQIILLFVGLFIAIGFNVDTLKIVKKLDADPKLRERIISQADAFIKAHPNLGDEISTTTSFTKNEADSLKSTIKIIYAQTADIAGKEFIETNDLLGLGWRYGFLKEKDQSYVGFMNLVGWLLTALAISMGAPFWFDLLNKMMKLRGSIKSADGSGTTTEGPVKKPETVG